MTRHVGFTVVGLPAPQGSKRHVGHGVMVETAINHKPWRAAVAQAAYELRGAEPMTGPLRLAVEFRFPMPKSRPKAVRDAGESHKVSAPDLDKLVRSVGDALTEGGLIHDDALICELYATKREVVGWTGAMITVDQMGGGS